MPENGTVFQRMGRLIGLRDVFCQLGTYRGRMGRLNRRRDVRPGIGTSMSLSGDHYRGGAAIGLGSFPITRLYRSRCREITSRCISLVPS
jgi:hypothetical protein